MPILLRLGSVRAILLLTLVVSRAAAGGEYIPPSRQAVDTYNAVGSYARLVAFMKIGAGAKDLRYLAFLNAKLSGEKPPRAFLAGQQIYFQGIHQPLRVIDLKEKRFSYNGGRFDLNKYSSVEQRMTALEKLIYPKRAALLWWDWIFPFAYAEISRDPASLAALTGVLAMSGLTSSAQCLSLRDTRDCTKEFMGPLAALGAVGGMRRGEAPTRAFCSPDFRGGQKFIIAGQERNLLSVSRSNGLLEISPSHLNAGAPSSNRAAAELLAACGSDDSLAGLNIAMAYPAAVEPAVDTTGTQLARRVPAAAPASGRAPASSAISQPMHSDTAR